MTDTPQVLLAHHLKALKLPSVLRDYDKLARQCAAEAVDHAGYLLRLAELGRVGDWRGGARLGGVAVYRRLAPDAGASFPTVRFVSSHRSSNRTCRSPASGLPPIRQAFALGRSSRRAGTR
jgi:hypothetical protein